MNVFFDLDSTRTQVWSNGGGVQSCAIAAMICRGELPKPDIAAIVNTEREKTGTFEYQKAVIIPALRAVGVQMHIVKRSDYCTVDLTSKNGETVLLPAYTNQSGEVGKLPTYCSGEWKRDALSRWLRERGVEQCDMWMGFSIDEMRRLRKDRRNWIRKLYPLIHHRKSRQACIQTVLDMGWPEPPRSACWMCPNMADAEWLDMRENYPEDFERAVAFEREELHPLDSQMFLHGTCVPLDRVAFNSKSADEPGCQSGFCFV